MKRARLYYRVEHYGRGGVISSCVHRLSCTLAVPLLLSVYILFLVISNLSAALLATYMQVMSLGSFDTMIGGALYSTLTPTFQMHVLSFSSFLIGRFGSKLKQAW